jgi:hypothetical protein
MSIKCSSPAVLSALMNATSTCRLVSWADTRVVSQYLDTTSMTAIAALPQAVKWVKSYIQMLLGFQATQSGQSARGVGSRGGFPGRTRCSARSTRSTVASETHTTASRDPR